MSYDIIESCDSMLLIPKYMFVLRICSQHLGNIVDKVCGSNCPKSFCLAMDSKASAALDDVHDFSPLLTRHNVFCNKIVIFDNFVTVVKHLNFKIYYIFRKCIMLHNTEEKSWTRCVDPIVQNHLFLQKYDMCLVNSGEKSWTYFYEKYDVCLVNSGEKSWTSSRVADALGFIAKNSDEFQGIGGSR